MPKYSVEDVLDIIKSFSAEEKTALEAQLPTALSIATPSGVAKKQQSQSFGNIRISGSSMSFGVSQVSATGSVNLAQTTTQLQGLTGNLEEALGLLQEIKQGVGTTEELNKLEKKNVESTISVVEEELQREEPDKDLIDQAKIGRAHV